MIEASGCIQCRLGSEYIFPTSYNKLKQPYIERFFIFLAFLVLMQLKNKRVLQWPMRLFNKVQSRGLAG